MAPDTSLVERAREYCINLGGNPAEYLVWQLADEIEALRARVAELEAELSDTRQFVPKPAKCTCNPNELPRHAFWSRDCPVHGESVDK